MREPRVGTNLRISYYPWALAKAFFSLLKALLPRDLWIVLYFELLCLSTVEGLHLVAYPRTDEMTNLQSPEP